VSSSLNQFDHLLKAAHAAQASLFAEGTKRNHKSNITQFMFFCLKFDKPVCPTTRDTLMAFARLASLTVSYGTLKNIFSSIKFLHKANNQTYPEDDWQLESTLKALKRELSGAPLQTLPITPEILIRMYTFVDINKPKDLAMWSSFLTSFYCMLRKASAVPKSLATFTSARELSRNKIDIEADGDTVLVLMNYSKTSQFGNKNVVIPLLRNPVHALDPVFHLQELFTRFPLQGSLPAFSFTEKEKLKCITYDGFTKELKRLLNLAGLKADSYSGHSFRRGGATYLYRLGADPVLIQASGDWATDCYTRYVFLTLDQRYHAQLMMTNSTRFEEYPLAV
jgi:integrase